MVDGRHYRRSAELLKLVLSGDLQMDLNEKSEMVRTLIQNLELPEGSLLPDPRTSIGNDATGSPEYVHAFEHEINGDSVQTFRVYISGDSVTLQYEYSTSCFRPFSGSNHVEKAVEDIGRFLKRGRDLAIEQGSERRQRCQTSIGNPSQTASDNHLWETGR